MLTPDDLPSRSFIPLQWMLALGGVARPADFRDRHCSDDDLRWGVRFGNIVRVRIGWYALPAVDPMVIEAVRLGGRLACASALAYLDGHSIGTADHRLHIEMPANAVSRVPPDLAAGVRVHWARRPSAGDRAVIDVVSARRQWQACRASLEG